MVLFCWGYALLIQTKRSSNNFHYLVICKPLNNKEKLFLWVSGFCEGRISPINQKFRQITLQVFKNLLNNYPTNQAHKLMKIVKYIYMEKYYPFDFLNFMVGGLGIWMRSRCDWWTLFVERILDDEGMSYSFSLVRFRRHSVLRHSLRMKKVER